MDNTVENKDAAIFNRDQVLSQIDDLLKIQDQDERQAKTAEFIDERLKLLTEQSAPREFSLLSRPRKGFLNPESRIRRTFFVDPFMVDDPEAYKLLIDTFKEFKDAPGWSEKSLRDIAPYAVLRTIGNYFGNHWSSNNTENNNRAFYMKRSTAESDDIHLNELKGKGIAVCAEKGAVAQNLLSFLGYESELVASTKCRLESPEKGDEGGHVYTVIKGDTNYFIFDPTNPTLIKREDGNVHTVMPSFYPINQESYQQLMSGGWVEVTHNDGILDGGQTIKGSDQRRIYGGPSQATVA